MPHFSVILTVADRDLCVKNAQKLISQIRPNWAKHEIKSEFFTEGITNTILSFWCTGHGPDERILLRIYGDKTELFIDRQQEIKNIHILHKHGCGAPLYATFENGIIYGYIAGKVLDEATVRDPHMAKLIAERLAQIHSIKVTGDDIDKTPMLLPKLKRCIEILPDKFDDERRNKRYLTEYPSKDKLLEYYDGLEAKLNEIKPMVVFCHNDLLIKNIIYEKSDQISFIDFEYGGFNYRSFDIGNHFAEYAGVEKPDFSRYPNETEQKWWVKNYLTKWNSNHGLPPPTDKEISALCLESNILSAAAHLLWSTWSITQSLYSHIDYDYLKYAIDRLDQYNQLKTKYWHLPTTTSSA